MEQNKKEGGLNISVRSFITAIAVIFALMAVTYPLYQLWLWLWVNDLGNGVFARLVVALPVGVAVGWMASRLLGWGERRVGIDG